MSDVDGATGPSPVGRTLFPYLPCGRLRVPVGASPVLRGCVSVADADTDADSDSRPTLPPFLFALGSSLHPSSRRIETKRNSLVLVP
jgi:hypothetical protein